MFNSTHRERRRAAVAVQVIVIIPVLLGFAAVSVDVGVMYNARSDMQQAVDSAALAAASVFAYAPEGQDPMAEATAAAQDFVDRNKVLGRTLTLESGTDVIYGHAYYDEAANTYNFVAGDTPPNAVRVTLRQTEDSVNGSLPLYFAGIFGKTATDLTAASVALFVRTCYAEGDCYDQETDGSTIMCHKGDSDERYSSDSESGESEADGGDGHTIIVDTNAVPLFLNQGDTLGACGNCVQGDSDDSDDSQGEFGPPDSSDSDDSDPGDSDGSMNGDSDDSDDSQGEFGPPDSDDSDDSVAGGSDNIDDSDESSDDGNNNVNDSGGTPNGAVCIGSIKVFLIQ